MEMCAFFSGRWTYEPRWSPDDPNVSILQSLRLVDELLPRGKRFEFEIYPGELHFFTRASSWIDAFGKMERFFGTEVRGESGTLAQPSSN